MSMTTDIRLYIQGHVPPAVFAVSKDIDAVEVTTPIDPSVPDESANDEPDALPEPTDPQAPEGPRTDAIPEEAI